MSRFRLFGIAGVAAIAFAGLAAAVVSPPVAVAQVPSAIPLGERPPGDVTFTPPQIPAASDTTDYSYSLCLGTAPAMPKNQECGGSFHPSTTVQGGHGPYHFETEFGFPPIGIHLDKDGNLTGRIAKGARGSTFRVCATDLDGAHACQDVTINAGAAAAEEKPAKQGMSTMKKAGILLGVAGGVGVGAAIMCQQTEGGCTGLGGSNNNSSGGGASCGSAPPMPNGCEGSQRNSSVCNAWINSYSSWCTCNGRTFNVNTGSCS